MDRIGELNANEVAKELQGYKRYSGKTQKEIKEKVGGVSLLRDELRRLEKKNMKTPKNIKSPKREKVENVEKENVENEIDIAKTMKDWMVYRNEALLYKNQVSNVIHNWPDTRNVVLKTHLKHLNKKSTVNAWEEIKAIYLSFLQPITESITTVDGIYTDWRVLKKDPRSTVYIVKLNDEDVIVKSYLNVERDTYATDEDVISNELYEQGFYVPKRYKSFNTYHYLCIPMQKLDTTLLQMYVENPIGIGLSNVRIILKHFIPILQWLHEHKRAYVDFSCGNVAFHHDQPYMIDFGALHKTWLSTPYMKTLRYESINSSKGIAVTYNDDYQSLGFVILEALYGPRINLDDKPQIISDAIDGKYGSFMKGYYTITENGDSYAVLLDL